MRMIRLALCIRGLGPAGRCCRGRSCGGLQPAPARARAHRGQAGGNPRHLAAAPDVDFRGAAQPPGGLAFRPPGVGRAVVSSTAASPVTVPVPVPWACGSRRAVRQRGKWGWRRRPRACGGVCARGCGSRAHPRSAQGPKSVAAAVRGSPPVRRLPTARGAGRTPPRSVSAWPDRVTRRSA